jgi:hypothetical protein
MVDTPGKPKDDGKIRLPKVDAAMNKLRPALPKIDDKGARLGAPKGEEKRHQKILARALKRFDKVIAAESDNRKAGLDDRKFKAGDQWPSEVIAQRNLDKRPCLTINKLPVFVHQITNDQRQNRPAIVVSPVGDRGDVDVAKMYRGLIRFIERDCAADIAYDTAFNDAVTMGWGYWRVLTEWESPDSFNLVLVVRRIRNPFTVYLDPSHQDPTGADAKWGFITDMVPRDEFEDKYPDADPMPFDKAAIGEQAKNWATKDEIRIAEYFEVEYKTRTLVALDNGHEGWKDELSDDTLAAIERGDLNITDERESRVPKVMWYKITAVDVLDEREWIGSTIPIVKVVGEEEDIEGKVKLSGVIRHAKDAQRMVNYWKTAETELIALAPKAPFIGEEGQFEGHEDEWASANARSVPFLSYKGTSFNGHPIPAPQRQAFAGVPAGVVNAAQGAAQDMMATTGIRFDATPNERMIDESGKAIRELRRSGDMGSFHFIDNLARSLRRTGEIMVEAIPKVYSDARTLTILREDDKEEQVKIDPSLSKPTGEMRKPDGKVMRLFNPKVGKYGVTVTIGPSFATKRIEASENMISFAKALPQTGALIADLIAKNQDWPGAEEIAARLAKTLPPGLLAPDMKDVPPQVQAILQQQDQQVKELGQKLQQAMLALNDKTQDRAAVVDATNKRFEAALMKVVADTETKMAAIEEKSQSNFNAHIGAQIKELGANVAGLIQSIEHPAKPPDQPQQQAAAPNPGELPPEAMQHLSDGRATTFGNGQKWTLKGGKPARVA